MSLESWKAEYYPIPADQTTREEAVAHSLKKWEGLRPEILKAHDVLVNLSRDIEDGITAQTLGIDYGTCALCFHAFGEGCERCPLFLARGGVSCDGTRDGEADSPWHTWCDSKDPEPMIHWLRKAQEYERTSHEAAALLYGGTPPADLLAKKDTKPPIGGLTCETPGFPGIVDPLTD